MNLDFNYSNRLSNMWQEIKKKYMNKNIELSPIQECFDLLITCDLYYYKFSR